MSPARPVRYAVVGLGHIAQVAVLPAFAHARRNSKLVAVVSDDRTKRRELTRRYRLEHAFSYDQFENCLNEVDAVYIALPNSMHAEYTIRAARAGVHVLCEKPMAVTVRECQQMIAACRQARVKLMIAYRLHFEAVNLAAMDLARRGELGDLKFFTSSFSMTVRRGDIRTKREYGGGTLYDIGVYCINAARNLFRAEPTEVSAVSINSGLRSLAGIDETAPVPAGSLIEQQNGRLTGLLAESAMERVLAVLPAASEDDLVAAIENGWAHPRVVLTSTPSAEPRKPH